MVVSRDITAPKLAGRDLQMWGIASHNGTFVGIRRKLERKVSSPKGEDSREILVHVRESSTTDSEGLSECIIGDGL